MSISADITQHRAPGQSPPDGYASIPVDPTAAGPAPGPAAHYTLRRERFAIFADALIPGGAGLPAASVAQVHTTWIDRTFEARPDLEPVVVEVIAGDAEPQTVLDRLREEDPARFDLFTFAVSGAYFLNPGVRTLLGYPGPAPERKLADPDQGDPFLMDGILDPVIKRGAIYRPTPTT